MTRFHLDRLAMQNETKLRQGISGLGSSASQVLGVIAARWPG